MTRPSTPVTEPGRALRKALASALIVTSISLPSSGQTRDPADLALAETLFREAKDLMDKGQHRAACPKLAESQRLDPAGGTQLLLGLCYEGARQWASAWTAFNDALAMAIKDNRKDREQRARERIAAIEPRMSRVTLSIPAELASLPGLRILRDGKELPKAAWTAAFPLDPGPHTFEARAEGYEGFHVGITLGDEGKTHSVVLPARLDKLAAPPAPTASASSSTTSAPPPPPSTSPSTPPSTPPTSGLSRRHIAYGLGALGVVGIGVGAFFGLRAISRFDEANGVCPDVRCSDPKSVSRSDDAYRDANLSNIGFGVGVVGLGAGVALFLLSNPSKAEASRPSLRVGAAPPVRGVSDGYLRLEGSF